MSEDLTTWADRLERVLVDEPGPIDRVRVLAETESTQDAAWQSCGGRAGLVVVAGRQTRGRGRLGKHWVDSFGLGVAMTLVVEPGEPGWRLSVLAGVAAASACERFVPGRVRVRWPNDVLEPGERGRKLAGVLVESRSGLALVGVGINVRQGSEHWSGRLGEQAVSLHQLGAECSRLDVARALVKSFHALWKVDAGALIEEWRAREWLFGRRCTVAHNGDTFQGVVKTIDPNDQIVLDVGSGDVALPAASSSVIEVFTDSLPGLDQRRP